LKGTLLERFGLSESLRQFGHSLLGGVKMRVDPMIPFIEPNVPVSPLAPTRRTWSRQLMGLVATQILAGRYQPEAVLRGTKAAHRCIHELRPLKPPVAKKFRIISAHHQRFVWLPIAIAQTVLALKGFSYSSQLLQARANKMRGMFAGGFQ